MDSSTLVYKKGIGVLSLAIIFFHSNPSRTCEKRKKGKEIDSEMVVEEHITNLKNEYSQDLSWIKISALLCFIV